MSAQSVNAPPWPAPVVDEHGHITTAWQWFLAQLFDRTGGTVDKVEAAHAAALAAVPKTTQVVAGGGLRAGGALTGNVPVVLYRAMDVLANLPTSGNGEGDWAYALNGRKSGETAGNGTGCPVWWSTPAGIGGWYTGAGALATA